MMVTSFSFFLLVFLLIGASAVFSSRGSNQDYYLASGQVHPVLVGLSAVATNNSGYMFIGAIGYTYVAGLSSVWLMAGWILGDFLASLVVHRKLRLATQRTGAVSFVSLLTRWNVSSGMRRFQQLAALLVIVFLLAYTSAQFLAGSKALQVLFGWPYWAGATMGAGIAVLYCFAGGIRASIWTDVAQSLVMLVAMTLLLASAGAALGGWSGAIASMAQIDGFLDWFPSDLVIPGWTGAGLFALSWMFAGLSVIGQPHIMVRFMALDDPGHMAKARCWYYGWFTLFYCLSIGVGMLSRVYLDQPTGFDEELALPSMALSLLPPVAVGLVLAGIFAATMSTADSLILSCSSAFSHDLFPSQSGSVLRSRIATVAMALIALLITFSSSQSVFALVIMAWSTLASAFAPLLIVYCLGGRPRETVALIMLAVGIGVAMLWRWAGLENAVYEGMPGILAGLATYHLWGRRSPVAEAGAGARVA